MFRFQYYFKYMYKEMLITEENTKLNDWELNELDLKYDIKSYDKTLTINNNIFYCTLRNESNMCGIRDWTCHVDNVDHDSIGWITVNTYEQIDKFLNLLVEDCINDVAKLEKCKSCFICKHCAISKGIGQDYYGICGIDKHKILGKDLQQIIECDNFINYES